MSSLLVAMSQGLRPLALLACLASLWAGPGTALAAAWQDHREAGFLAFDNADYAAAAEHLENALAAADQSQASARERGVVLERLTTSYLATRWFRRAHETIARWDRVLEGAEGESWAYEQRSVRDSLAVLVEEVIGDPEPEPAAAMTGAPQASGGEAPASPGATAPDTGSDAEVDVPFLPDEAPPAAAPVDGAANGSVILDVAPASASSSTPGATPAAGGYALHLVSLTDPGAVEGSWATLQEAYPEILAGKDLAVRQVDLGDKGVFYRLHAAAFAAPEAAQVTCEKLRSLDQYCAVVDLE